MKFEIYSVTCKHSCHLEQMASLSEPEKPERSIFFYSNGGTPTQLHIVFMTWIKGQ